METKRCSKCGEVKVVDCFHKLHDGHRAACKECRKVESAIYNKTMPQHLRDARNARERVSVRTKLRNRKYAAAHREVMQKRAVAWNSANGVRVLEIKRASKNRAIEKLESRYVREVLSKQVGCKNEFIPPELIEAKRAHLQMVRILKKEKQKCQTK